jgi:hypothetical protein
MPACRGQVLPQEDLLRTGAILKGIAMGARYPADSLNSDDVSGLSQAEQQAAREEQQVRGAAGKGIHAWPSGVPRTATLCPGMAGAGCRCAGLGSAVVLC